PLNSWQTGVYVAVMIVIGISAGWMIHLVFRTSMRLFWWQFVFVGGVMLYFLYAACFGGHLAEEQPWHIAAETWHIGLLSLSKPFPHLWQPLTLLVFLVAALSRWPARYFLSGLTEKIKAAPNYRQLSQFISDLWNYRKPDPPPSFRKSLFDALSSPVEILYPSALFLVLIDIRLATHLLGTRAGSWIYYGVALCLGIGAYAALVWAERNNAIAALRTNVRRVFWHGGSWLTTVFVILLAGCWLWGVSYVTTVMQGGRPVVFFLILASYAVFWT